MYVYFRSFAQLLGILSLIISLPVNADETSRCYYTVGGSGRCINIKNCGTILRLLEAHGNITRNFLRRLSCGFDDSGPKVCCPTESELEYGPLFAPDCGISIQKEHLILNQDDTVLSFPSRISAGEAAIPGSWPWIAALGYRTNDPSKLEWRCGGSLISKRHILTAAHCIIPELLVVRLGDIDLFRNDDAVSADFAIEKTYIHPDRIKRRKTHDIGILRLQRDVKFTDFIRPICLPILDELLEDNYVGLRAFVIGWGRLGPSKMRAGHLQQVEIPVVDVEICKSVYEEHHVTIDDRIICAGHPEGRKDACEGDSGGPLTLPINNTFYEIGIISYGVACAYPNLPGVYTSISRNLDFILSKLN